MSKMSRGLLDSMNTFVLPPAKCCKTGPARRAEAAEETWP